MPTKDEFENRLRVLKDLVFQLEETIVDKESKDILLRLASNSLSDVESCLLPRGQFDGVELTLALVEKQLLHARALISKYGPNLRVVGG